MLHDMKQPIRFTFMFSLRKLHRTYLLLGDLECIYNVEFLTRVEQNPAGFVGRELVLLGLLISLTLATDCSCQNNALLLDCGILASSES